MKKLLTLFFALTCATSIFAHDCKIKGIYYNLDKKNLTAEVTNETGKWNAKSYSGDVVIPRIVTYKNIKYSVKTIGKSAFEYCEGLTSVTIPNSVTTIGDYAFAGCSGLTSITIPNSVITIGRGAFSDCSSLTSVTIPNSVTTIGDHAFDGCSGLTSITIPNSVITIGTGAFSDCSSLTSIIIPKSVAVIGSFAFLDCSSLTSVTILNPNAVMSRGIFLNCNITNFYCHEWTMILSTDVGTIKNVHRLNEEDLQYAVPFDYYAKGFVESEINEWQQKGKYEKTTDWQKRVNRTSRKAKVEELYKEAQKNYLEHYGTR